MKKSVESIDISTYEAANLYTFMSQPTIPDLLFVCVEVQSPSQQYFSHVGMEPTASWVKCLALGQNMAEVGFEPRHQFVLSSS